MTTIADTSRLSRRSFLSGAATAAAGLLVGVALPGPRSAGAAGVVSNVTAWVSVGTDEKVTILVGASEMGQGVLSGLPQILAEELIVDWRRVVTAEAPADPVYANPLFGAQMTGGSTSVRGYFDAMLKAGAIARVMLIRAAAARMGVAESICTAALGVVTATGAGKSVTYGAVAADAALLPQPSDPPLLSQSRGYILVGKPVARPDIPSKVNGKALFGIDVRLPGMLYAAVKHSPVMGSAVAATPAVPPGALAVVNLGNAVAVVARDTWQAFTAARQVSVQWSPPASRSSVDSASLWAQGRSLMTSGNAVNAERVGDPNAAMATAAKIVEATYSTPFLPHACMEPLNCTVSLTANACDVWVPTQAPGSVMATAAALTGLPDSKIKVHSMLMGGGLGRKFEMDYVVQAIKVAQAVGKPVKLTWSREQDFANDQYRPMCLSKVKLGLNATGGVVAWQNRIVQPSILFQRGWIPEGAVDSQAVDGAIDLPYAFQTRSVDYVRQPTGIPVGFWRSVGHSINAFVVESAVDEAALAAGIDPLAMRRRLLAGNTRALRVLNTAARLGGWGTALPPGHARGIAYNESFGSIAAQVIEVERVSPVGVSPVKVRVAKVAVAVDCGLAVNPDSIRAQMHSGIVHGLNAAQWGEIRFDNGIAQTTNFDDFAMMRLRDMPQIAVAVLQTPGVSIGGIGEVGVPCAAPALANAYAALTGVRLRDLPLRISTATSGDD